jgi:RNA polymerase sigma-70 factor (ECF subfamily)
MKSGQTGTSKTQESQKGQQTTGIFQAFLQNESLLKRFLRRFLYKQEDIDEISQETFLRAYKATKGREIDSPKAYLFQVARSLAYSELSRKTRKLTDYLEDALEENAGTTDSLEEEIAAHQKVSFFFDAIAELPPQCRRVFLMRKVQGMPHKAIAASLGIGASAVEKHIAIGTQRCKKYIETREGADNSRSDITDLRDPQDITRGQTHE